MSDDLVKRARHNALADMPHYASVELIEALADRIEELEDSLAKTQYRIEGLEELLWAAENDAKEAEAYAGELEAANANLKAMIADKINSTGDDPEIMAATRAEWAARAKAAEAKLAKALEALEDIVKDCEADYPPSHGAIKYTARITIAELKGGKDE